MTRLRVDDSASVPDGVEVWPLYDAVFADHPDLASWREGVWDRHRVRDGFRLARAHRDDELVGFAYGYTGEPGQWWTDQARGVLPPEVADRWVGGHFELVSVGVASSARGCGVGRELVRSLCRDLPHERLLLMTTADPADPARRLYDSEGWRVLGRGIGSATVIMGRLGDGAVLS
ncbi:GNAT family N-acetyltransferase [Nocardioides sp.]|uniref:GNAT family N-acetyltransferase n=1 Tax=Nocardioides sp. TaxID=35761 RepID=UPI00271DEB16|nr:GNAT family N-acetyltransferase [Nocardioides sp.]MDO9457846.1 GNAT family N-acetyltransferase [Nocardioides sp.]